MLGLYYSTTLFDNPYINYALHRYPDTSHVATDEAELQRYLELTAYDIILLELKSEHVESVNLIAQVAEQVREHTPETVIIVHRSKMIPLYSAPLNLPLGSYDFSFTNKFGVIDLEETMQTLILRRLSFVSNNKEPCNISGILCMRHPGVSALTYNYLRAAGFNIIRCNNLQKIATEIAAIQPDFLFMHCDTKGTAHEQERQLAAYTKTALPQCLVLVSCDIEYQDRYAVIQPVDPDTYDHLMDPAPMPLELLLLILKEESKKYKLDIIEDPQH
ncbi:hypothetical protein [Chitinophaga defluvii]|uniref:Response regulatory domain-containing protein n=1 Tax=Chitinophaga defluvii TaxID=3163343 RepID=A0ABV2TAX2_9BACT